MINIFNKNMVIKLSRPGKEVDKTLTNTFGFTEENTEKQKAEQVSKDDTVTCKIGFAPLVLTWMRDSPTMSLSLAQLTNQAVCDYLNKRLNDKISAESGIVSPVVSVQYSKHSLFNEWGVSAPGYEIELTNAKFAEPLQELLKVGKYHELQTLPSTEEAAKVESLYKGMSIK